MSASISASLGTITRRKGRAGRLFDVGGGRMLCARQIALETGCNPSAVYARVANGWSGKDLLRPRREKVFDCGKEWLTIKQIMRRTGLSESAVRSRLGRGETGASLLRTKVRRDMAAPRSSTMVLACKLADAFPDRLPTTREIRRLHPMAEGTAERWLTAMRAARERV